MISFREMEYEFWERFSQIDLSDNDEEKDESTDDRTPQSTLKYNDMHSYGLKVEPEFFTVVACKECGMVLKPQRLEVHMETRHRLGSLLDAEVPVPAMPKPTRDDTQESIQPFVKRQKLDTGTFIALPKAAKKFTLPSNSMEEFKKPKTKDFEPVKLKMKLKKTDRGMWSVVAANYGSNGIFAKNSYLKTYQACVLLKEP